MAGHGKPARDETDLWYSGKAHIHGGNVQAVHAPDGFPLWVSKLEPGSVHDITAARAHALPALYRPAATGLPTLADPGYDGAGIGIGIRISLKQHPETVNSISAAAPATPSSAPYAAWANAGSHCSPSAGAHSSTSLPAPARSVTSPAPPSFSPI